MNTAALVPEARIIDLTARGPEFEVVVTECARYLLTAVAAAGDVADDRLRGVAVERIGRFGRSGYGPGDLDRDLADGHLHEALESALAAVADDIDHDRREALLAEAVTVARAGDGPSAAQARLIADTALVLGVPPLRARLLTGQPASVA